MTKEPDRVKRVVGDSGASADGIPRGTFNETSDDHGLTGRVRWVPIDMARE